MGPTAMAGTRSSWFNRGCTVGYEPAIKTPLLQRRKNYLNFRLSGMNEYFNPLVIDACGNDVFRKRPTTWTWTCAVLGKMTSLKNLEVIIREDRVLESDGVFKTLGNANISPEGCHAMQSFVVRLWKLMPWDRPLDDGEESRWRRVLVGDEGQWIV
ncbi:hypothetical protein BDV96DRAFT_563230 [Lophiotrema nucula]|uniref:Uncharacterized protein n=1 Tax=Lophiotrema nucula TaxID=690887 RepID=A0A6A5ZVK7_9PLEO|nr:hypothetical protein BDV96DRAFT_563230 [Lophiotrema nucula]